MALAAAGLAIITLATGLSGPREPNRDRKDFETMPTLAPERPRTWPWPPAETPIRLTPLTVPPAPQTITPAPRITPEPMPDGRLAAVEALLAGAPLAPFAGAMLAAADAEGIDWRLLPVIAVLESSGGRHACGGNAWGYASCAREFGTFDDGISVVTATLARAPYAGLSTEGRLCMWVSGGSCANALAAGYLANARPLLAGLEVAP